MRDFKLTQIDFKYTFSIFYWIDTQFCCTHLWITETSQQKFASNRQILDENLPSSKKHFCSSCHFLRRKKKYRQTHQFPHSYRGRRGRCWQASCLVIAAATFKQKSYTLASKVFEVFCSCRQTKASAAVFNLQWGVYDQLALLNWPQWDRGRGIKINAF